MRGVMAAATLAMCAASFAQPAHVAGGAATPIIFVHGNGDDASRWIPTVWLFESNGYPADRLFAIRFHNPVARTDETREEAARSSSAQAMEDLGRYVQDVLHRTRAAKVILVGSSRGGLTIRNYVQNGGGKPLVEAEVLCGTPNHGVTASPMNLTNEFNGSGNFLLQLNRTGADGLEVTPGVRTLTLRSDNQDKYAQPTGIASGRPDTATGVTFEGPALKGAENVELPHKDHREVAFSDEAFAAMYRFVTGHAPVALSIKPQRTAVLSGLITGFAGLAATNDPLDSVHVRVSEVRRRAADRQVYETTTTAAGTWGPFRANPTATYSYELEKDGRRVTYFLPALKRSTSMLNFRFATVPAGTAIAASNVASLLVTRPEGYFSSERDPVRIEGEVAAQEPAGLPIRDSFVANVTTGAAIVELTLRGERILAHPSPDFQSVLPIAEFLR